MAEVLFLWLLGAMWEGVRWAVKTTWRVVTAPVRLVLRFLRWSFASVFSLMRRFGTWVGRVFSQTDARVDRLAGFFERHLPPLQPTHPFWGGFRKQAGFIFSWKYWLKVLVIWPTVIFWAGFLLLTASSGLGDAIQKLNLPDLPKINLPTLPGGLSLPNVRVAEARSDDLRVLTPVCSGSGLPLSNGISGYHYSSAHRGLDLGGYTGEPVPVTHAGEVVIAGWNDQGYGNLVVVSDGETHTYYAHLSRIDVGVGDRIRAGQIIGAVGSTGNSTGSHLHYEVRRGSDWHNVNPLSQEAQLATCP